MQETLEQILLVLSQMQAQQIKQTFLLHCCAVTLGILWGSATWVLLILSKNESEFL